MTPPTMRSIFERASEAKQTPRLSSSLDEVISVAVSPESCSSMILNVEVFIYNLSFHS